MRDRAPGEDAGRRVEDLLRGVVVERGRDHRADAALAEAPGGGGIRLRDLLQHLHEGFRRRFGAAEALRQQRAIEPVLDQRGDDGRRQPPRPLDLVGLARDQRRDGAGPFDQTNAGSCVHSRFLAHSAVSGQSRDGGLFGEEDQGGAARHSGNRQAWNAESERMAQDRKAYAGPRETSGASRTLSSSRRPWYSCKAGSDF